MCAKCGLTRDVSLYVSWKIAARTPLARHCAHRYLRIKISWSLRVQYGIVVQVHVRRFQTSRTAFIVMLYCAASADDLSPLYQVEG